MAAGYRKEIGAEAVSCWKPATEGQLSRGWSFCEFADLGFKMTEVHTCDFFV